MEKIINSNDDIKSDVNYLSFARNFAIQTITDLVTSFNRQVNNRGWVNMRVYHDHALIDEFIRRGIDVSCIYDGQAIDFSHHVRFNSSACKLITAD